jgi:hypothetical protein
MVLFLTLKEEHSLKVLEDRQQREHLDLRREVTGGQQKAS